MVCLGVWDSVAKLSKSESQPCLCTKRLAYHGEPMVQERLLEGLRSFDASRRLESIQTLVNLTGGDALGYVSWRSPEENASAIAAWEQYLATVDVVEDEP